LAAASLVLGILRACEPLGCGGVGMGSAVGSKTSSYLNSRPLALERACLHLD